MSLQHDQIHNGTGKIYKNSSAMPVLASQRLKHVQPSQSLSDAQLLQSAVLVPGTWKALSSRHLGPGGSSADLQIELAGDLICDTRRQSAASRHVGSAALTGAQTCTDSLIKPRLRLSASDGRRQAAAQKAIFETARAHKRGQACEWALETMML